VIRHRLKFGSTCVLSLTRCSVDRCYALIDWSSELRWASADNLRRSAFSSFEITNANGLNVSSAGVTFTPSQSDLTIRFTVHTCDNFYRLHPFTEIEDCAADGPEISAPIRGLPFCAN
jgi:hypothetical protein